MKEIITKVLKFIGAIFAGFFILLYIILKDCNKKD